MWTLLHRFDPETEARFQAHYAERSIPFIRFSLPVAITLYLFFLFWDHTIDPAKIGLTLAVRISFCVIAITAFGLTFLKFFEKWAQPILCATAILGASGVLLVLAILPDGITYGIGGLLLVVMYACGFIRLLWRPALVACGAIVVITNAYLYAGAHDYFTYFNVTTQVPRS